jgi:hypothetical protein
MAVLVLQVALIGELTLRFLRATATRKPASPTIQPILLDRDDSDRIGFKQRLTSRRKTSNSRFGMSSDPKFALLFRLLQAELESEGCASQSPKP